MNVVAALSEESVGPVPPGSAPVVTSSPALEVVMLSEAEFVVASLGNAVASV